MRFKLFSTGNTTREPLSSPFVQGAGGDDATDFAEMLMRMYLRYAEKNKMPVQVLDTSYAEGAGIKSALLKSMPPMRSAHYRLKLALTG